MQKGAATAYWQKGIFCIKLTKEPSDRKYQEVVLGVDPGSKREGYTAATKKSVVLNITTDTPDWVKRHIETRRTLRRSRRQRKTPYRPMRNNRSSLRKSDRIPSSTLARWNAKLRVIKLLQRILPLTCVNVEDVRARTKRGQKKWNSSFSSLEQGKGYFYGQIGQLGLKLIKTQGYQTHAHRIARRLEKSKRKLDFSWEAHNVDSHVLCELVLGQDIKPFKSIYRLNFLEFHRRQLHVQNPIRNGIRKPYGTTISLGIPRGSIVKYKGRLVFVGGTAKGRISVHNINTGKRIALNVYLENICPLYKSSWRMQLITT